MTQPSTHDQAFADLLDDLLDQILDGLEPDLAAAAARHPAVAERVDEALALAAGLAGRKVSTRPTLQGYEVLQELGRGGMGTVYLARQSSLDRQVAIKVLPHSFGLSAASRKRFLEEARALAQLKHEHIVDIHRVVDDGEMLAFEMEYVEGPSLHAVLTHLREHRERTRERPTLQVVADFLDVDVDVLGARNLTQFFVELARKVARALAAVHAAGLVHRDIKPANLLLRQNGDPVVVDFGLVRLRGLEATHAGRFAGTPVYSSPEQLRGDVLVGPAADVYSLGVTLYECLTLATPFAGRTTTDLLQRIEQGRFKPLRKLSPDAPRDLETIVAHAMEIDAMKRYADGGQLADDLQRLLELRPIQALPISPLRHAEKFARRNRKTLFAAAVGAVLVALLLLPILHEVEARERERLEARDHARAARTQLVHVDSGNLEWRHAVLGTSTRPGLLDDAQRDDPLGSALAEYDAAVALGAADADVSRERDVVRLALWLRRLDVAHPDAVRAALSGPEFAALTGGLGPMTSRYARVLAGDGDAPPSEREVDAGGQDDRMAFGLLAYLFGDFRRCELAWSQERSRIANHPLVDAGLGRLLLADGMAHAAYARLLQAKAHFPDSDLLTLDLADAALQLGQLQLAQQWLDVGGGGGEEDASLPRRRLQLDLRAARGGGAELVQDYAALLRDDPFDPTARHRLAQLAMRRGDLATAERHLDALLRSWPEAARFRLDRARVALLRRDLPAYGRQVLAVLEQDFGRELSRGSAADLLEILRIGGLEALYVDGVAANDGTTAGRRTFGDELPIRAFAPPALTARFEENAQFLHDVRRAVAALRSDRLDDISANLLLTVPVAATRAGFTSSLSPQQQLAIAALPLVAPTIYDHATPLVRPLLVAMRFLGWRPVMLHLIPRPADLSKSAFYGSTVRRVRDRSGDGVDDLLIASSTPDPKQGRARVTLVDPIENHTLATLHNDSDRHLFGYAIAVCEDLDGDGVQDWLVGSPGTPAADDGRVDVFSGRTATRVRRLSAPDHGFGVAVAALDDCDGDGTADFAVSTSPLLLNAAAHGSVRVYSGRTFAVLAEHGNEEPGVWFGARMANVGDADGDGVADLLVGGNYGGARGIARLYSGRSGAVLHTWEDRSATSGYAFEVGGAGDVDGDGLADVFVSAVPDDRGLRSQLFCYSGRTGRQLAALPGTRAGDRFGTVAVPYTTRLGAPLFAIGAPEGGDPMAGAIELRTLAGETVTSIVGPVVRGAFGWQVVTLGDLDGDSLPELVVSALGGGEACHVWRVSSRQFLRPQGR